MSLEHNIEQLLPKSILTITKWETWQSVVCYSQTAMTTSKTISPYIFKCQQLENKQYTSLLKKVTLNIDYGYKIVFQVLVTINTASISEVVTYCSEITYMHLPKSSLQVSQN